MPDGDEKEVVYTCYLCAGYVTDDESLDGGSVARGHYGSDEDNTLAEDSPGYGLLQVVDEVNEDDAKQGQGVDYGMSGLSDPDGPLSFFGLGSGGGGAGGAGAGAAGGGDGDSGLLGAVAGAVGGAFF